MFLSEDISFFIAFIIGCFFCQSLLFIGYFNYINKEKNEKWYWHIFIISFSVSSIYLIIFSIISLITSNVYFLIAAFCTSLITITLFSYMEDKFKKKYLMKYLIDKIKKLDYMHLSNDQIVDIINYKYTKSFNKFRLKNKKYYLNNQRFKCDDDMAFLLEKANVFSDEEVILKSRKTYSHKDVADAMKILLKNDKEKRILRDNYNKTYNDDYINYII